MADICDRIVERCNSKEVTDLLEPNVVEPFKIEKWMAKRILWVIVDILIKDEGV